MINLHTFSSQADIPPSFDGSITEAYGAEYGRRRAERRTKLRGQLSQKMGKAKRAALQEQIKRLNEEDVEQDRSRLTGLKMRKQLLDVQQRVRDAERILKNEVMEPYERSALREQLLRWRSWLQSYTKRDYADDEVLEFASRDHSKEMLNRQPKSNLWRSVTGSDESGISGTDITVARTKRNSQNEMTNVFLELDYAHAGSIAKKRIEGRLQTRFRQGLVDHGWKFGKRIVEIRL